MRLSGLRVALEKPHRELVSAKREAFVTSGRSLCVPEPHFAYLAKVSFTKHESLTGLWEPAHPPSSQRP